MSSQQVNVRWLFRVGTDGVRTQRGRRNSSSEGTAVRSPCGRNEAEEEEADVAWADGVRTSEGGALRGLPRMRPATQGPVGWGTVLPGLCLFSWHHHGILLSEGKRHSGLDGERHGLPSAGPGEGFPFCSPGDGRVGSGVVPELRRFSPPWRAVAERKLTGCESEPVRRPPCALGGHGGWPRSGGGHVRREVVRICVESRPAGFPDGPRAECEGGGPGNRRFSPKQSSENIHPHGKWAWGAGGPTALLRIGRVQDDVRHPGGEAKEEVVFMGLELKGHQRRVTLRAEDWGSGSQGPHQEG